MMKNDFVGSGCFCRRPSLYLRNSPPSSSITQSCSHLLVRVPGERICEMPQAPMQRRERPVPEARRERRPMERKTCCVYNQTRECFLSFDVKVADTMFLRFRGLIGRLKPRSEQGLWVVPSWRIHTLGLLFPVDIIYLDEYNRVIDVIEHFPSFR